jgi:hypothetical protein
VHDRVGEGEADARAGVCVCFCVQEVVSVLKETMETTPSLLLPILDAVSGFSLPPHTLESVHQHVMGELCHSIHLSSDIFHALRSHSIRFSRAEGVPKYDVGLGRGGLGYIGAWLEPVGDWGPQYGQLKTRGVACNRV